MFLELKIGARYLLSKRRERFISIITWLAVFGIAVSVAVLIVVTSVMSGFHEELRSRIVGVNAHVNVTDRNGIISDYSSLIQRVAQSEYVVASAPYVSGQVITRIGDRIQGAHIRGIAPAFERAVSDVENYVSEGRLPETGREVMIGKELAGYYGIRAGDTIEIYSPSPFEKALEKESVRELRQAMSRMKSDAVVVGIFDSGMYEYDVSLIFTSVGYGQELFQLAPGEAHGLNIKITESDFAYLAREDIKNILGYPYLVRGWMDLNRRLFAALQTEKRVMFLLLILAVAVAVTNIVSTLVMLVMEKTKDIGIFKTIGFSNIGMGLVFVILGLLIGVFGTLIGVFGGLSIIHKLGNIETWLSNMFGYKLFPPDIYYFDKIPTKVDFFDISLITICAIILSVLSAWYPAWKAARLNPVEAIRYE